VKEDFKNLPSKSNLYLSLLGGGLALGAHQFDSTFNGRLISHYNLVNTAFKPGKIVGQTPVQMGLALVTYSYGRATTSPKVSHFGMDLLRAQILAEVLTEALKVSTRRERPNHQNHFSFPSGHASITFASATVIERHLGWRQTIVGYTIASYVAASRLHDNRHYLSDVVFGATIGAISGRTVTQHGRDSWTIVPVTVPGGVAIMATRRPAALGH
jgi:membrane-associated phospholipid phosphatase